MAQHTVIQRVHDCRPAGLPSLGDVQKEDKKSQRCVCLWPVQGCSMKRGVAVCHKINGLHKSCAVGSCIPKTLVPHQAIARLQELNSYPTILSSNTYQSSQCTHRLVSEFSGAQNSTSWHYFLSAGLYNILFPSTHQLHHQQQRCNPPSPGQPKSFKMVARISYSSRHTARPLQPAPPGKKTSEPSRIMIKLRFSERTGRRVPKQHIACPQKTETPRCRQHMLRRDAAKREATRVDWMLRLRPKPHRVC